MARSTTSMSIRLQNETAASLEQEAEAAGLSLNAHIAAIIDGRHGGLPQEQAGEYEREIQRLKDLIADRDREIQGLKAVSHRVPDIRNLDELLAYAIEAERQKPENIRFKAMTLDEKLAELRRQGLIPDSGVPGGIPLCQTGGIPQSDDDLDSGMPGGIPQEQESGIPQDRDGFGIL